MDFYTSVATIISSNSQFLLLLVVTYCVLKIVHLEKEVKYLRYDYLCLKDEVMNGENENDEEDTDEDEGDENDEDEKDADYDPEEESSDSSDEGDQAI